MAHPDDGSLGAPERRRVDQGRASRAHLPSPRAAGPRPTNAAHVSGRVEEPTDAGRALHVGAFVLADPFDTILRELSVPYLERAWRCLVSTLKRHGVSVSDLTWGWLYPTETWAPGLAFEPGSFTGWASRELARFDLDDRYAAIDRDLRAGVPSVACAVTWRSRKWAIAPDAYSAALALIEDIWTDEPTDWASERIVAEHPNDDAAWVAVARALLSHDQVALDGALSAASARYSPAGYRLMLRGYGAANVGDFRLGVPGG